MPLFPSGSSFITLVKYSVILWISLCAYHVWASGNPITGTIRDAETKESIPFASVGILGKPIGTISNEEGNFILDTKGITPEDTIVFHCLGYETFKIRVAEFQKTEVVYLLVAIINLGEVQVLSRSLSAEEIIKRAYENFNRNYPSAPDKQRIFFHKYGKIPFSKKNKLLLKETDFVGLDKKLFEELLQQMPHEFIEYQDATALLYRNAEQYKLVPLQGISLKEGAQQALLQELEVKLSDFFTDIEKSMGERCVLQSAFRNFEQKNRTQK